MTLNQTPASERIHIGIFGRRNAGKSSLINAITGQSLAIVSDVKGTTTDPVTKAMELLPLGPIVLIDTPGLDDEGELGQQRIQKAYQMLNKTDLALLVVDAQTGMTGEDERILERIKSKQIPYLIVNNKSDLLTDLSESPTYSQAEHASAHASVCCVSARTGAGMEALKEQLGRVLSATNNQRMLIRDKLSQGAVVVLVVPIDSAAPKGRLILPQQQTIRDILDADATAIVVKDTQLKETLEKLGGLVSLVITDSQAFRAVAKLVPPQLPLTSFSILFARYKGNLKTVVHGAQALEHLQEGDCVLISEGCTHHRQCNDIGTVKLPRLVQAYTGKKLAFAFTSGMEFPEDLSPYSLIIHCGGCMLNAREMQYRLKCAEDAQVPITNYGTAIAHMNGILARSLEIFAEECADVTGM